MRTLFTILFLLALPAYGEVLESLPYCKLPDGPMDASRLLEFNDCTFDRPLSLTLNYVIVDSLGHPVDSEDYGPCRHYDSKEWQISNPGEVKKLRFAQALLSRHPEIVNVRIEYYRNGKERVSYPNVDKLCSMLKGFSSGLQKCVFGGSKRGYPRIVISIGK
jgi:hypothetical protein